MNGSVLVRVIFGIAGIACLAVGLFPRSSQGSGGTFAADGTASARSSRTEFTLGLPSSPVYRSATVVSETVNQEVERQLVSRHDQSSTSRIEFLSWSAALVAIGTVLLLAALRSRARPAEPTLQAGSTKA